MISKILSNKYLILILRLVIGSTFIYASFDKIIDTESFAKIIYNYQLLPNYLVPIVSILLPWLEFVSGLFLITGLFMRASSFIISSLLLVFIIAIITNIVRGVDIDCGCFSTGDNSSKISWNLIIRDIALLISAIIIFIYNKGELVLSKCFCLKK